MLKNEIVGFIGVRLYRVEIPAKAFQRLALLTNEGAPVPTWIDLGHSPMIEHRVIATDDPSWFEPMLEQT